MIDQATMEHPDGRDPSVDHVQELHPPMFDVEDRSEVVPVRLPSGELVPPPASNVDGNGVAHFLLITPDPEEPDVCGGCEREWPCADRVGVEVAEVPRPTDPDEERLQRIALAAVREALGQQPQ